jgi:hypothetical protein
MKLFSLLLSVVAIFATAFAQVATSEPAQPPFSLVIRAVNADVKAGDGIELRVRLTNNSDHPIMASESWERGLSWSYNYDVHDASGNVPKRKDSEGPRVLTAKIRILKSGESLESGTLLSEAYDMNTPGIYVAQLSREIYDTDHHRDGVVKSNKITVTVAP